VLVVGGGNSGAQINAEVSQIANATWVTLREPTFMPNHVDGRYLFDVASRRWQQRQAQQGATGETLSDTSANDVSLGDIVMVPPVKAARERGVLHTVRPFSHFTEASVVWSDGWEEAIDAVIWCTGFRSALDHLGPLGVIEPDGRVLVEGTRALKEPMLWLLGYGDWTGYAFSHPGWCRTHCTRDGGTDRLCITTQYPPYSGQLVRAACGRALQPAYRLRREVRRNGYV
jgi:putative flavoprotein involved in K+ transport